VGAIFVNFFNHFYWRNGDTRSTHIAREARGVIYPRGAPLTPLTRLHEGLLVLLTLGGTRPTKVSRRGGKTS
jgi:hypothetical protein